MLDAQSVTTPDMIIQAFRDEAPPIRVSHLRPMLESGVGRRRILEEYPTLTLKKIFKAKGYYDAKIVGRPRERVENALHVLCDENLSNHHVRICQRLFGYATSVTFEDRNGKPDIDVWTYAQDNGFDLIVTHDKRATMPEHLTSIALEAWRDGVRKRNVSGLPLVLHLTGLARQSTQFGKIAAFRINDIFNLCSTLEAPILRLDEYGLHQDTRWDELFAPKRKRVVLRHTRKQERRRRFYELMAERKTQGVRTVRSLPG